MKQIATLFVLLLDALEKPSNWDLNNNFVRCFALTLY